MSRPYSISLRFLEALKRTLLEAAIVIGSPVAGFLPARAGPSEAIDDVSAES